jgi:hypothetical protein
MSLGGSLLAILAWIGFASSIAGLIAFPFVYAAGARAERLRMRARLLEGSRPQPPRNGSLWGDVIELHHEARGTKR